MLISFMTQDASGAKVISNCMSWVRALVPFSELLRLFLSLISRVLVAI